MKCGNCKAEMIDVKGAMICPNCPAKLFIKDRKNPKRVPVIKPYKPPQIPRTKKQKPSLPGQLDLFPDTEEQTDHWYE